MQPPNMRKSQPFRFKQFSIQQHHAAMKVNTDGVLLGAWAQMGTERSVLDIGTGTGVIALMAAQRCPTAQVTALEIDADACIDARANVANSQYKDRVAVVCSSVQSYAADRLQTFDHIITNPPYFVDGTTSMRKGRSTARHAAQLPFQDLIDSVHTLLAPEGQFSLILPYEEGTHFQLLAEESGMHICRKTEVYKAVGKLGRLLMTFALTAPDRAVATDTLLIREADGAYSSAYRAVTRDFYLHF